MPLRLPRSRRLAVPRQLQRLDGGRVRSRPILYTSAQHGGRGQPIGPEAGQRLRERVAREIKTTFASHSTNEVSLAEALRPDAIAAYGRQATGEKYLIRPNKRG